MKNNWKWVYNPFEKVAGWKAFGIGIVLLTIITIIGYLGNTVFYGLSIKTVPSVTWNIAFSLQALGLAVTVFVMWISAVLSAKHVRFQDILGTVTLAKYPLILAAIMSFLLNNRLTEFTNRLMKMNITEMINGITFSDYVLLFILIIILIPVIIWVIVLLFNAFRVSTNLKGIKCVLLFAASLLISEIITLILVTIIY